MCDKKLSLFDKVLQGIECETQFIGNSELLPGTMVHYISSRTGREAFTSAARAYAIRALGPGLRKRYIGESKLSPVCSESERESAAIDEFLTDNDRCRKWNSNFASFKPSGFLSEVIGETKSVLFKAFGGNGDSVLNLSSIASHICVGPGSSSGDVGDAGTYGRLFGGPMSFGSTKVRDVYRACILLTHSTAIAESIRRSLWGALDSFRTNAIFLSVPKTNDKNRGICTQPSGNMALQLATHGVLKVVLKKSFDCDLSDQQEKNKHLAMIGSLGRKSFTKRSWEFCTVDLSHASNFPWMVVVLLFPEGVVAWLDLIRSHFMEVSKASSNNKTYVDKVEKHMCSTMGNGFTFSLMTVLLSAIVKTLYAFADLPEYDSHPVYGGLKTWAVYGDDIIIDKSVANALFQTLELLGFTINYKKTFIEGPFRESCGGDFYDGYPVRPVFVESLQSRSDIVSLINRLVSWGVQHSVELPYTLSVLRSALKANERLVVPNWEDVTAGIHAPFEFYQRPKNSDIPFKIRSTLNKGSLVYRSLMPITKRRVLFRENSRNVHYSDIASKCRYSYTLTSSEIEYVEDVNLAGAYLCTIEGSLRMGQYGIRSFGDTVYEQRWRVAPSWGTPLPILGVVDKRLRTAYSLPAHVLWEEYVARCLFGTRDETNSLMV